MLLDSVCRVRSSVDHLRMMSQASGSRARDLANAFEEASRDYEREVQVLDTAMSVLLEVMGKAADDYDKEREGEAGEQKKRKKG